MPDVILELHEAPRRKGKIDNMDSYEDVNNTPGAGRAQIFSSNTSSHHRYTPESSNSSSSNLQHRLQSVKTDRARMHIKDQSTHGQDGITGSLLQERLREKKAAMLQDRRQSIEVSSLRSQRLEAQSSPITSSSRGSRDRDLQRANSSERISDRPAGKKGMGAKEMEETVSTLHKQNFDLKLELFHRRQRQTELETRVESLEAQITDQDELQSVNEQLLTELEKREQAIEEAMGLIMELEEKNERLISERAAVRAFDAANQSFYLSDHNDSASTQNLESSPPQPDKQTSHSTTTPVQRPYDSGSLVRMPSFLSEQSENTEALRSLYLPTDHRSRSILSLPKLPEENGVTSETTETEGMNSPRLSVLSESSFVSVYGGKDLSLDSLNLDLPVSPNQVHHRKSSSIEKWVTERSGNTKPIQAIPSTKRTSMSPGQFLSINNVVKSPLQRLEKLQRRTLAKNCSSPIPSRIAPPRSFPEKRDTIKRTDVESFNSNNGLPPTPDTFSTNTLRQFGKSNDTLGQDAKRNSPPRTHSFLDRANIALEYSRLRRPRSAVETITSRRDGHGWDTATQSEYTETNSEQDVSTLDPWIATAKEPTRPAIIPPPDMFSFNSAYDDDWSRDTSRDIMYSRDNEFPAVRSRKAFETGSERRNENTPTARRFDRTSAYNKQDEQYSTPAPIDGTSAPNPPERRSSLAVSPGGNEKRRRRQQMGISAAPESPSFSPSIQRADTTPQAQEADTKRSRFKIFSLGRSVSSVVPQSSPARPVSYTERRPQDSNLDLHAASATPPPISRYPRGRTSSMAMERRPEVPRPSTSGSMESRLPLPVMKTARRERRDSIEPRAGTAMSNNNNSSHVSGALDSGGGDAEQQEQDVGGTKKRWPFSIGRTASLRK